VADALRLALGLSDAERNAMQTENGRIIATRAERGFAGKHAAEKYCQLVMHREDQLARPGRRSRDGSTGASPQFPGHSGTVK
jgi:hypothetical protein